MTISAYREPGTLMLRLAAAGLVADLPKLDVRESVLREHEGALLGPQVPAVPGPGLPPASPGRGVIAV